ncbi:DUF3365 domain-containing protein [Roseivirga sp. BDSF3-8]|uniref:Tll0287-like domain-containing protein n=1 Tax=Roseivirga sp. BDSF3-8 TaxID=3241598 RepID=UPI003531BBC1
MTRYFCLSIVFATMLFSSCDMEQRKITSEALKDERKSREIKQVKEGEILNAALQTGREVSRISQQELIATLQLAIEAHGVPGAVTFCNVEALSLMDSLSTATKSRIRRVSQRYRNPKDEPNELEANLLDAYAYSVEQNEAPGDNIQMLDNGKILYTKPILLGAELCLNCHGTKSEISPETQSQINELYPQDKATGYQIGQLRGMWSIELDKTEIIKNM